MRDPGIHLSKSQLRLVINRNVVDKFHLLQPLADKIVSELMVEGRQHGLTHRSVVISQERFEKKITKMVSSNIGDANLFANLLLNYRRKLKHRGLQQIKASTPEWAMIKTLTTNANNFCREFGFEKRDGYLKYMKWGIQKISKFSLQKLIAVDQAIYETAEAKLELQEDTEPGITEKVYQYYINIILSKTGMPLNYKEIPEKYVFFWRIRKKCRELGLDYHIYIDAQFAGLEYREGIPDPIQLMGDKANNRLAKYMFEKGIKIKGGEKKINWKKILKDDSNNDK